MRVDLESKDLLSWLRDNLPGGRYDPLDSIWMSRSWTLDGGAVYVTNDPEQIANARGL